jgi:hypothetical protein
MKIDVKQHGNLNKTYNFLTHVKRKDFSDVLDKWGREGVAALSSATPRNTGTTAESWEYNVKKFLNYAKITWSNTNLNDGIPIAILIQYGHGTKNGAYVEGVDFINPAMRPIFEQLADSIWKEVTRL